MNILIKLKDRIYININLLINTTSVPLNIIIGMSAILGRKMVSTQTGLTFNLILCSRNVLLKMCLLAFIYELIINYSMDWQYTVRRRDRALIWVKPILIRLSVFSQVNQEVIMNVSCINVEFLE
ncbi:hypothetical protein RF11_04113 [Thelohanellus kitauei]|uniref:Uncharacterized protein n=1 Tax=Thelohanellus kitauei TaxID=669202 RepID=A0A0C2MN92_THEKT|nr:hypothetical protein RF11_04113 [Thelohanellus kitauei]